MLQNNCPTHKNYHLNICLSWNPPNGLDPKMRRYVCSQCFDYWYKAPKHVHMRANEIQVKFGIDIEKGGNVKHEIKYIVSSAKVKSKKKIK